MFLRLEDFSKKLSKPSAATLLLGVAVVSVGILGVGLFVYDHYWCEEGKSQSQVDSDTWFYKMRKRLRGSSTPRSAPL